MVTAVSEEHSVLNLRQRWQLLTAVIHIQSHVSSCGISDGHDVAGARISSESFRFPVPVILPPILHLSIAVAAGLFYYYY
jgi:hypothetical protein